MLRRTIGIAAAAATVTIASVVPAAAQTPELTPYNAGGTASALTILLAGQELTFSGTSASVTASPEASANGRAVTTPLFSTPGAPVTSTGAVKTGVDCTTIALPSPINLAGVDIPCVRTSAAVNNNLPIGSSTSDEINLDLISAELVGQVVDAALRPALEQLLAGLDPLLTALDPLLGAPTLDELITQLLDSLAAGDTLATLQVGVTGSDAERAASNVVGQAATTGAHLDLLPALGPLASVTVGSSQAQVTVDPATAVATPTASVANIDIDLAGLTTVVHNLLAGVTGQLGGPIAAALGPVLDTLLGTADTQVEALFNQTVDQLACPDSPLAAVLCFSLGGINQLDQAELAARGLDFGANTVGIEASVLSLDLLDGTLVLGVGRSAAAANGVLTSTPRGSLPGGPLQGVDGPLARTGGEAALPLTLALLAVGTAGAYLLRRTRTV